MTTKRKPRGTVAWALFKGERFNQGVWHRRKDAVAVRNLWGEPLIKVRRVRIIIESKRAERNGR